MEQLYWLNMDRFNIHIPHCPGSSVSNTKSSHERSVNVGIYSLWLLCAVLRYWSPDASLRSFTGYYEERFTPVIEERVYQSRVLPVVVHFHTPFSENPVPYNRKALLTGEE